MINQIIKGSLNNRMLSIILVLLICVVGYIAFNDMPVDVYPDLNAPLVNIVTENEGMSAEDVERLITLPLESTLNGSPGVTRIRSESSTGISVVTVEFDWNTDVYLARQIVAGKLELVDGQLPAGTTSPMMGPISSRMGEIYAFVLTSDNLSPMELRDLADWTVRYRLLSTAGVSYVINLGGDVREYQVLLEPQKLREYGISITQVREAIEASNRNSTGGILDQGQQEYLIRGLGQIHDIDNISEIVVDNRDGVPVYVSHLAEVKIGKQFSRGNAGHNGKAAVMITVEKQFRGNTLATIENVEATLEKLKKELPEGLEIYTFYNQGLFIKSSVDSIQRAILEGAILITLVVLLFMGDPRSVFIVIATIPYSIFIAVMMMWLFGVTINVMSLGGLAIGIGKMANSSIFVVENIYRKLIQNNNKPKEEKQSTLKICFEATKEIAPALFSANLIIFLVFVPMFFLQGIEGKMFAPTAFAVGMALVGSFLGSITIKPVLASMLIRKIKARKDNVVIRSIRKIYLAALELVLKIKYVFIAATAIIIAVICLLLIPQLGAEFLPQMDEGAIVASAQLLPGTSLEETTKVGQEIEQLCLNKEKFPEIVSVNRETGRAEQSEHAHPVSHSHFMIELLPKGERERSIEEIIEALRQEFKSVPGVRYIFEQPIQNKLAEMLTGTEGELSVKLFGPELEVLDSKIHEVRDVLKEVEGTQDLQIELTSGVPRINILLDRQKLARFGIKIDEVSDVIETALNGQGVTDFFMGNKRYSILLRFAEKYRDDVNKIENLLIDTPSGQMIPLSEVSKIDRSAGPEEIFRENTQRRKVIILNVGEGVDLGSYVAAAQKAIEEKVDLPTGYHVEFGGQYENQQRATEQLLLFSVLIAIAVFLTLISSFHSLRQSMLILLNVPVAIAGGIVFLFLSGASLNVSSLVGFIALFGISLQNGIILVGTFNRLRKEDGMSLKDAVMHGAGIRLRPVLMTELVMMLGALPLVIGNETGGEIHQPLAIVYLGGFLMAMIFSKFLLPALYYVFESFRKDDSKITSADMLKESL